MKDISIQVFGSGCPTCKNLYETSQKITKKLKIDTEVEYITDVAKMVGMGILTSPSLVLNGKVVLSGKGHGDDDVEEVLKEFSPVNK